MFWHKKSRTLDPSAESVQQLAKKLGVERRQNVRVFYPKLTTANLPAISFEGRRLSVFDLSVGGCCLIDHDETLGLNVGGELTLSLHFANAVDPVRSRLVGRINDRRHVQFMDLNPVRVEQLRAQMLYGIRALGVKSNLKNIEDGPGLEAQEIWSSMQGDALIIESGVHRVAQAEIAGKTFYFYKQAWPVDVHHQPVATAELHGLILFIANINYRSSALNELLGHLEHLTLGAPK